MRLPVTPEEKALVDPQVETKELSELFRQGSDWLCTHCQGGNARNDTHCSSCGAPQYNESAEDATGFAGAHRRMASKVAKAVAKAPTTYKDISAAARRITNKVRPGRPKDPDYAAGTQRRQIAMISGAALLLGAILWFGIWATSVHTVEGQVDQVSWERQVNVEAWTHVQVRNWRHQTSERAEIPPRQGRGERAGMALIGNCARSYYGEGPRYACGTTSEQYDCSYTESYQGTCSGTRSVPGGGACSSNGNGSFSCGNGSESYSYSCTKSRRVPKTCTRDVTKYCTDPVYEQKCDYRTQRWQQVRTRVSSGLNDSPHWPEFETSDLERAIKTEAYGLRVSYIDRNKRDSVSRKLKASEYQDYRAAKHRGKTVWLQVNNLGGVRSYGLTAPP